MLLYKKKKIINFKIINFGVLKKLKTFIHKQINSNNKYIFFIFVSLLKENLFIYFLKFLNRNQVISC